ncbi:MAG: hypothetical protein ACK4RK_03390 [Gemmataceae bacterium]
MHIFSRLVLPGLIAGLVMAFLPANGSAQMQKPERVKFETVDQVELIGTFYPSNEGKKAVPVLILSNLGDSTKGEIAGRDRLAAALQEQGFAVLHFDWRGHGDSITVGPNFWNSVTNQKYIRGAAPNRQTINKNDFPPAYYPMLINDITAARMFLDRRNDASECNSANLIVIGMKDGATLGALWLAGEMDRHRVTQTDPLTLTPINWDATCEGKRVTAAIWLSMTSSIGGINFGQLAQLWLKKSGGDYNLPMAFLYGEQDRNSAAFAGQAYNFVTNRNPKNHPLTAYRPIKGTMVAGAELIQPNLETEKLIIGYALNVAKQKGNQDWAAVNAEEKSYVWKPTAGGVATIAKMGGDKNMLFFPLSRFNIVGIPGN